jgi:hypothetical protein
MKDESNFGVVWLAQQILQLPEFKKIVKIDSQEVDFPCYFKMIEVRLII